MGKDTFYRPTIPKTSSSGKEINTPLLNLQIKQIRNRLNPLLANIKSITDDEEVTPKTIAFSYLPTKTRLLFDKRSL